MKYFPSENIIYRTKLSGEEINIRLSEIIEPAKGEGLKLFRQGSSKPYSGTISGDSFQMMRNIRYRNSFLPRIKGLIIQEGGDSIVKVQMRLHTMVFVFLCIWFGGIGAACLVILIKSITTLHISGPALIPFGMFLFGSFLTVGAFKTESGISKADLKKILEAEMTDGS